MPFHGEEFTTIRVDLIMDGRAITLVPRDEKSSEVLQQVLDSAPGSFTWNSGGMQGDNSTGRVVGAYFSCGGKIYSRREANATWFDYAGSIKIHLDLRHVTDDDVIGTLRSYCWYGLEVDPQSTVDSFRLIPTMKCKLCKVKLTLGEMEWQTCNSCADKCEHEYTAGVGTHKGLPVDMVFCGKCGRAHPDWKPSLDPVQDMLNTVAYGDLKGLILKNPDGSFITITQQ